MNPEAKKVLSEILEKSPEDLEDYEIRFLRARRSYLKPHQLEEFKSVLVVSEEPTKKGSALKGYFRTLEDAKKLGWKGKNPPKEVLQKFIESKT